MNDFSVEFVDRAELPVILPPNLAWTVQPFGAQTLGGSDLAKVTATGSIEALWRLLGWLRYAMRIRNAARTECWSGYVHEVEITAGAVTAALSLTQMANRIAVRYAYEQAGKQVSGVTSWAQDDFSVATFGAKEKIEQAADCRPTTAAAFQAALLTALSLPVSAPPSIDEPATVATATLYGRGWIHTLDWQFYAQPQGRIVQNAGGAEQVLGWGFVAPLGFKKRRIYQIDALWAGLPAGGRIQVSGLAANNGSFLVDDGTDKEAVNYSSNTIYFQAANDILDNNFGLDDLRTNELIQITGSANNSGYHVVSGANSQHVTTDTTFGGAIVAEAVGPTITIKQGNFVHVTTTTTQAAPSANATVVAHGMKIAQRFTPLVAGSFVPGEIVIRARKVGAPLDYLQVSLQTDSAGGPSGTILDSAQVAAADVGDSLAGIEFLLARTATLTYGAAYHLVIERTGSNSNTDYFVVEMDEKLSIGALTTRLWTGAVWTWREVDANLTFQIWGYQETTQQMAEIAATAGQFGVSVAVQQASGVYDRQYREGNYTALSELTDLLNRGTTGGQRLIALMWPGTRALRIQTEPVQSVTNNLILRNDGRFYWPTGAPLAPGVLPVGQWVTLADVPPAINSALRISPVFIEACEYDPSSGRWRPTATRGAQSIYELAKTKTGAELFKAMKPLIVGS